MVGSSSAVTFLKMFGDSFITTVCNWPNNLIGTFISAHAEPFHAALPTGYINSWYPLPNENHILYFGSTREDLTEGASFWGAFLTSFRGLDTIVFFNRNYTEASVWPKPDTKQAHQKFGSNAARHNLPKKIVQRTNAVEVKHHTTKQKPTEINAISPKQNTVLDGIETYSFTHGEAWARPRERGLGKAWRGPHISKIRLWSGKQGRSRTRELWNFLTGPWGLASTSTERLSGKNCRILGRKFFRVIGSNRTQQKHWKGLCPNITQLQAQQKHCKNALTTKLYLAFTGSYASSNAKIKTKLSPTQGSNPGDHTKASEKTTTKIATKKPTKKTNQTTTQESNSCPSTELQPRWSRQQPLVPWDSKIAPKTKISQFLQCRCQANNSAHKHDLFGRHYEKRPMWHQNKT